MNHPDLYRKRLIPSECILLKDDEILQYDEEFLITKWTTLKPRSDFHHGYSCYFFQKGIKISKFYREDGTFVYWYCDIVSFEQTEAAIYITDLLADVIIMPDGEVKVLDLDELCEAKERSLIDSQQFFLSVKHLSELLSAIEDHTFTNMVSSLEKFIP